MKDIPVPYKRGGSTPECIPQAAFSMLEDPNISVSGDQVAQNLMRICGWFCSPELNPRLATILCRTNCHFCESSSDFILSALGNDSVQPRENEL